MPGSELSNLPDAERKELLEILADPVVAECISKQYPETPEGRDLLMLDTITGVYKKMRELYVMII